jgi:hypothetical protein
MNKEKLEELAKDLRKEAPRSPREVLGGYVILARCLDKGRADLMGINGEYNYWYCSLCAQLEEFTGVDHAVMKEFIATGATDEEVGEWFKEQSKIKDPMDVLEYLPVHPPVYVLFDVYDIEEGRL